MEETHYRRYQVINIHKKGELKTQINKTLKITLSDNYELLKHAQLKYMNYKIVTGWGGGGCSGPPTSKTTLFCIGECITYVFHVMLSN